MRKRSDYITCPHCGASLDVGEKCDCNKEKPVAEVRSTETQTRGQKIA